MGVDAVVFARNAKRYFYFDRLHNVVPYDAELTPELRAIVDRVRDPAVGVSGDELRQITECSKVSWRDEGPKAAHRVQWNEGVERFIALFPGDNYFIVSDHDEPYWPDVRDKLGAVEWSDE